MAAKSRLTPREMSLCALMTVLICLCSWLTIPSAIPFTMQTFAVFAALLLLGGRLGTWSVLLYIIMGAVGLPVFHGFQGGIGILFGATGGYISGFVLMALLYRLLGPKKLAAQTLCLLAGLLLCYGFGTAWYAFLYGGEKGFIWALGVCVLPFVLPDIVKLALAVLVKALLKKRSGAFVG